jgi:hypothetical protein
MSKSFTCRELMGICDESFSGDTFMEIMQKGMEHMGSDDAHKEHISGLSGGTQETQEQWFERMQKEFDAKPDDQ